MCNIAEYLASQAGYCLDRVIAAAQQKQVSEAIEWAQTKLLLQRAQKEHDARCKACKEAVGAPQGIGRD